MKNYKVKATRTFIDIEEKIKRIENKSIFLVTEERYKYLKKNNAVSLMEVIQEEVKVEKPKKTKKASKRKEDK